MEINVEPGIAVRAALVKKYLPGCELLAVRKQSAGQESMDEVLKTPDGRKVDLPSLRQSWAGTPANQDQLETWINPKLAALLPSLKIKIATVQEAEDVARIILGVFKDRGGYDEWALKVAKPHGNDWLVSHDGPGPFATIELIRADGILQDARVYLPRGSAKQSDSAAPHGTLHQAYQKLSLGSEKDELIVAPSIDPKGQRTLEEWVEALRKPPPPTLTTTEDTWLLFRSSQLNSLDQQWIDRVERKGDRITVVVQQAHAIVEGGLDQNAIWHAVFGLNLGKLPAGDYRVECVVESFDFQEIDDQGRPKRLTQNVEHVPKPLEAAFTVLGRGQGCNLEGRAGGGEAGRCRAGRGGRGRVDVAAR